MRRAAKIPGKAAEAALGFGTKGAERVGDLIADVLDNPDDSGNIRRVRAQVAELTRRFPVYRQPLGQETAVPVFE